MAMRRDVNDSSRSSVSRMAFDWDRDALGPFFLQPGNEASLHAHSRSCVTTGPTIDAMIAKREATYPLRPGLQNPLSPSGPVCHELHDLLGMVAEVDVYTLDTDDPVGVDDHKTHQAAHRSSVTRQVELFCYRKGWIQE